MLHYLRDTTTQTGLRVRAHLVVESYQIGERITDEELAQRSICSARVPSRQATA